MFGKQMLLSHPETRGHREDFDQRVPARILLIYHSKFILYKIVIYGDSSFAGAGLLSKFF